MNQASFLWEQNSWPPSKVFKGGLQQDDLGTRVKRELLGEDCFVGGSDPRAILNVPFYLGAGDLV